VSEEGRLDKELKRGAEASQLIENPIFREVMDGIEQEIDDLSLSIPTTDKDLCVDIIMRKQVFESIKGQIVNYIQTGRMAKQMIEQNEQMNKEPVFKR